MVPFSGPEMAVMVFGNTHFDGMRSLFRLMTNIVVHWKDIWTLFDLVLGTSGRK